MIASVAVAVMAASSGGVPIPKDLQGQVFVGGPYDGLIPELRGEKTQLPPENLARAMDKLFVIGAREDNSSPTSLVTADASQAYNSSVHPNISWTGKIENGFLIKFSGCVHTTPWLDSGDDKDALVHFYWSCDKKHPYLIRTDVRFAKGKVTSWYASDVVIPILASVAG